MKRWEIGATCLILFVVMALFHAAPAAAINHKVKITNTTNEMCNVWVHYLTFVNMDNERRSKSFWYEPNHPNNSHTFEFGAKCPAVIQVACGNHFDEYRCFTGRKAKDENDCAIACYSSDWFIRGNKTDGLKLTKE